MSNILWKSLLVTPAVLGATLVVTSAIAQTTSAEVSVSAAKTTKTSEVKVVAAPEAIATPGFATGIDQNAIANIDSLTALKPTADLTGSDSTSSSVTDSKLELLLAQTAAPTQNPNVDQLNRYSREGGRGESMNQVTSVSQLSDVQPTDWAFQALQSLVERYGCIAGYPDGTYRGNRALTRYEFAAGLNACLDRVNELIATATADLVTREDLATLQRLQEEFSAELAALRGRVDSLEARTAELEANQFSTTTKLVGEAILAVTDTFGDDGGGDNNTVFQDRVRLDLQSSFTGRDILHTRLATGNARPFSFNATNSSAASSFKTFEGTQTFNLTPDTSFGNDVFIDWLSYSFPVGNSQFYIAASGGIHSDYTPTLNPYLEDFDGGNGALSAFAQESPIYRIGGGAGAAVNFAVGSGNSILRPTSLTLGYLAARPNDPGEDSGLFNGDYAALAQLNFTVSDTFSIAATYVHGYHDSDAGIFNLGAPGSSTAASAVTGTTFANNPATAVGLPSTPLVTNSYGVEAALRLGDKLSLSGWVAKTDVRLVGLGDGDIWTYALGLSLPDFGKEGNLLGLIAGVEPTLRGLEVPGNVDFDRDYGYHLEGFYKYRLTDNISITPGVIWLTAPGQNENNDDVVIGTLRTTFTF